MRTKAIKSEDEIPKSKPLPVPRKFSWTVVFTVDSSWVADGFQINDDRAMDMLSNQLPYAYDYELRTKVIAAPLDEHVAKVQGYKSVADWKAEK